MKIRLQYALVYHTHNLKGKLEFAGKLRHLHISAALSTQTIVSYNYSHWRTAGGEWWKGRGEQLAVTQLLGYNVETWHTQAVSAKQLQNPATERQLLPDLHAKLRSLFVTSVGLRVVNTTQAFYFTLSRPRHLCLLIIRDAASLRVTSRTPIQFT